MTRLILVVLLLTTLTFSCKKEQNKKDFYLKFIELILSEENIGRIYKIKEILKDKVDETEAIYLGELNSDSHKYKIMYSIGYYGNSPASVHANSILTLFDEKDNLIGFYSLGGKLENPPYLKSNTLIFPPDTLNNCNQTNKIDFGKEIPKEFFLECKNNMGDIYKFQLANEW